MKQVSEQHGLGQLALVAILLCIGMGALNQQSVRNPSAKGFPLWMARVRHLAPCYGYRIQKDDESWEEWFWLYYYLENASPRQAVISTAEYDHVKRRRLKGCNGI